MKVRISAMNRKIPAVHHVTLVSRVVAWRPPMIVSVPAPPPSVESPPPCPACSSTALARISESRIRMTTRIVYMRGARYLGYGGAHKLRPVAWVERRSSDQHAIQLVLGKELGDVLQVDAAAVENDVGCRCHGVLLQPGANRVVDFGRVLGGRVASGPDGPHGFVRDRDAPFAVSTRKRRLELAIDDVQCVARLALLQGLADTEHGVQRGCERRGDLLARLLIRLTEHMPALRMPDEGQTGAGLFGERPGDRPGEGTLGLPMDVLRAHLDVAMACDSLGDGLDRHRRREKPHRPLVRHFARGKKGAQVLARFNRPHVHLPVAREDQRSHLASNAATPGSSFPSRNSSDAPPPVETCVSLSSMPATAATEAPPPTTVTAPFCPASTSAFATARVPASNGGVSNTPIGPFQKIVFARSSLARKSCCVVSSMSNTAQPFGTPSAGTDLLSLPRSSDGAITAPRGRISFLPLCVSSSFARAMRSGSTNEFPTSSPIAAKKVHAMAPPINNSSTFGNKDLITSIFPEIFAPPSTAMNGRLGLSSSCPRYSSSFSIRNPATAGLSRWATASVDECARWAEPNASFT